MFHRKVKTDLPSIPLSLIDTTSSARAGHRSVKHAEEKNKTRTVPSQLDEEQPVMFLRDPNKKRVKWSSGTVKKVDGERSYTVKDTKTGAEYSRNRTHIKPVSEPPEQIPASSDGGTTKQQPEKQPEVEPERELIPETEPMIDVSLPVPEPVPEPVQEPTPQPDVSKRGRRGKSTRSSQQTVPSERPRRQVNIPGKYKDFVLK
jgi:hypothetical protein